MATEKSNTPSPEIPLTSQTDLDAIHICPKCKKDVASGRDASGRASLCSTCDDKIKLLAARLRILPSFQHTAVSRIQRRGGQ